MKKHTVSLGFAGFLSLVLSSSLSSLFFIPTGSLAGDIPIGASVFAEWSPGAWYHGTVTGMKEGKYEVRFDDGDKATVHRDGLRLHKRPAFTIGTPVFAQWADNSWYHGKIHAASGDDWMIHFDDGDQKVCPREQIVVDIIPNPQNLTRGSSVLAQWRGAQYFPGIIATAQDGTFGIQFDDGDTEEVSVEQIRLR